MRFSQNYEPVHSFEQVFLCITKPEYNIGSGAKVGGLGKKIR